MTELPGPWSKYKPIHTGDKTYKIAEKLKEQVEHKTGQRYTTYVPTSEADRDAAGGEDYLIVVRTAPIIYFMGEPEVRGILLKVHNPPDDPHLNKLKLEGVERIDPEAPLHPVSF